MAADRFEDVIRHAHLSEFGDYRVPQIVEPQADSAIEAVARTLERADSLWHTEPGITSGPRASGDDTIRTRRLPLTLRSLFIGGEPAVSGLFDHLALAAGGEAQVSCRPNGPLRTEGRSAFRRVGHTLACDRYGTLNPVPSL